MKKSLNFVWIFSGLRFREIETIMYSSYVYYV